MDVSSLPTFENTITSLKKKGRLFHLLLGNGFSMAYDKEIFSYNALSLFLERNQNELVKKLFEGIKTKNFEIIIMQQLDSFAEIAKIFSADKKLTK